MRQDNVAGFDFENTKNALLPKMWQMRTAEVRADACGRYTWQTRVADARGRHVKQNL